nr:MAG TPA: hypothetical protein [Caudoviricetes sp.]
MSYEVHIYSILLEVYNSFKNCINITVHNN